MKEDYVDKVNLICNKWFFEKKNDLPISLTIYYFCQNYSISKIKKETYNAKGNYFIFIKKSIKSSGLNEEKNKTHPSPSLRSRSPFETFTRLLPPLRVDNDPWNHPPNIVSFTIIEITNFFHVHCKYRFLVIIK